MRRVGVGVLLVGLSIGVGAACSSDDSSSKPESSTSTTSPGPAAMQLTSPAFADGGTIPTDYTCTGAGGSPELRWSAPPKGTKQLALVVFDPDAGTDGFVHDLVWDISPERRGAPRDAYPGGTPGMNGRGTEGWVPPCPPTGTHHYEFTIYALDRDPELAPTANLDVFTAAIEGSVIGEGKLTGRYGR